MKYAENSNRKIRYIVGMYNDWHNFVLDSDDCDDRILWSDLDTPSRSMLVKSSLCYSLCCFVTEMVKKDDSEFPPNSVKGCDSCYSNVLEYQKVVLEIVGKG